MKKASITETDKSAFFSLLTRAAQPLVMKGRRKSGSHSSDGCNGSKTHSRTSGDDLSRRDGKSR